MTGPTPTRRRLVGWLPFVAALMALLLVLAACAQKSGSSATSSAVATATATGTESASASEAATGSHEITVSTTSVGQALAGDGGKTLYKFDNDSAGKSACNAGCFETWPPFTLGAGEHATAGAGVTGEIGSITRDDGKTQVTYKGSPVYYYSGDQAAGDATGDGLGGVWHIAAP